MWADFKKFLLRGNVVDLAVGVVVGAAFGSVVSALVADLLTPLIAALVKVPDFSGWVFVVNESKFMIGHFVNALISFLLVSASIFFFVIKPMNLLTTLSRKEDSLGSLTKKCPECLSEIPIEAKRCSHCAQIIEK